ncbi:hypothetical protein A0O34_16380 [Chryseobacterium glaciei]|uniref:Uncharacterized protein n=1 Tax=Chryseobacterium glaciei TaxID=1685010 RepID=A0A172XYI0_9FLAO|nr:hypothetical protein [Chryseobacterium glaciei]ANF51991.1 hypothetical protein A0O34_16380 [Chryseobacterium glaciei]
MKTILTHDSKIQQGVILLFILTILIAVLSKKEFLAFAIIIEFFIIAFVQYTLNIIKFFNKKYIKTESRKVYMFLSTYVVIGVFIWIFACVFYIKGLKDIFEILVFTWLILSPVLILQSLCISFFDAKNHKGVINENINL